MRVPNGLLTIELEEREVFWKGEWHLFPPFFASCVRQSQTCKPPFTTNVNKEQHPSSNKASPFSLPLPQTALLSSLPLLLLIAIFHLAARRTEASTPVALLQKRKREEALNSRAKKSRSRPSLSAPNAKLLFAVTQIPFSPLVREVLFSSFHFLPLPPLGEAVSLEFSPKSHRHKKKGEEKEGRVRGIFFSKRGGKGKCSREKGENDAKKELEKNVQ